jgi:hypothetical protein
VVLLPFHNSEATRFGENSPPSNFQQSYDATGFGDLKPTTSLGRLLAMSQGLLGTLFLVFAISRFASLLPQVRDRHGEKKKDEEE